MLSAIRKQGITCDLLIPAVVLLEAVVTFVAGLICASMIIGVPAGSLGFDVAVLGTLLGTVILISCLRSAETYSPRVLSLPSHVPVRVMVIAATVCSGTGFAISLLSPDFSWNWGLAWAILTVMALGLSRMAVVPVFRRWMPSEGFDKRIAVVGAGDENDDDLTIINRHFSGRIDRNCISTIYTYPDNWENGRGDQWVQRLHADGVEEVVILPSLHNNRAWIHRTVKALEVLPIRVSLAIPRPVIDSNCPGYVFAALIDQPLSASEQAVKRLFDATVSLFLLVFLAPLMLLTALLIKLESKGPVLFRQERYGFGKEIIHVYKFRSMYHEMSDQLADKLTERDDPRVTKVGAFIRRFSIDELPQLLNVLRGEMSMVGPRPNPLNAKAGGELYDRVVDNFYTRYRVLPGITGWAQINGLRGNTDTKEKLVRRVEYDLYYIQNWSFWLDLKIVLLTPLASLEGENAF
ncbi:MAG: exopolysaccharide biosynthesis polyprenyl glycosylphosphotransferase [Geminicoccaceae bacterium]